MFEELNVPSKSVQQILQYVLLNNEQNDYPWYMKVPLDFTAPLLSSVVDRERIVSGYVYAHTQSIPLHVDRYNTRSQINLCIPLWTEDTDQKFIVFDQEFPDYGMTWHYDRTGFNSHRPSREEDGQSSSDDNDHQRSEVLDGVRPCDTDGVQFLTNEPVPEHLRADLPTTDHTFYHGLTGNSWSWTPNKALMFRSAQMHTTGVQTMPKIGYVLLLAE